MAAIDTIKPGTRMFVAISGEPVFVLGLELKDAIDAEVRVRRLVQTRRESSYCQAWFTARELETFEEKVARELADLRYIREVTHGAEAPSSFLQ